MSAIPSGLSIDFTRDALAEDYAKSLFDYWCEARGTASMPPVDAIDPTRLPVSCLPYLSLLEVEQAPLRLRSRLTGTALIEHWGVNQAGQYLDEIPGTSVQLARLEYCVRAQRPTLSNSRVTFAPNDHKIYQSLVLPFGDPDYGVQRLLGVFSFLEGFDTIASWTR
jgi:hypothetical protein